VSGRRSFLLSPRFLRVWLLNFCAAGAGFQLFPTAPFRLRALGAPPAAVGLFLTALTFGSALSAAWTGSLGDLLGRRRVLSFAGLGLAALAATYAIVPRWWLFAALGLVHGVVWSSVLTGGNAEGASVIPADRRAEGLAWLGTASTLAVTAAPAVGFFLLDRGWGWLCLGLVLPNLAVAAIALALPRAPRPAPGWWRALSPRTAIEWRTLRLSAVMAALSFGYGGVTSFVGLLAERRGIEPKGIFFTVFALSILVVRPLLAPWADRFGARRALPPLIAMVAAGLALVPVADDTVSLALAALVYGAGFSAVYPVFSALILARVPPERHGAAFGAMLAAFDIGIGSGSLAFGPLVAHVGERPAFWGAAALALAAWPLLLLLAPESEAETGA
jgi:MFS family permease